MVVDDEWYILDAVTMVLEMKGFEVFAYSDAKGLIENIKEHKPDVVLLDVQLGGFDGRHLCKSIKDLEEHSHIPVLLFSANKHYKSSVTEFMCDDFIEKPFNIDYFLSRVAFHAKKNEVDI